MISDTLSVTEKPGHAEAVWPLTQALQCQSAHASNSLTESRIQARLSLLRYLGRGRGRRGGGGGGGGGITLWSEEERGATQTSSSNRRFEK